MRAWLRTSGFALCLLTVAAQAQTDGGSHSNATAATATDAGSVDGSVTDVPIEPATPRQPYFGVAVDVGLPDVAAVSFLYRPIKWVRLEVGPTYNLAGWGVRGGVTIIPFEFAIMPTLTIEAGHYFSGDVNKAVSLVTHTSLAPDLAAALNPVTYTYANLQLGLELGSPRSFIFSIHFGLSYVTGSAPNIGKALGGDSALEVKDPSFRFVIPSAKIGFMVFFG